MYLVTVLRADRREIYRWPRKSFEDYTDEIQQSYELGFTPYRLHKRPDGVFVTSIRVYMGRVYILDDVTTMQVTTRQIATEHSKLIYSVKGDDGGALGFALHGDRGPDPQEQRV